MTVSSFMTYRKIAYLIAIVATLFLVATLYIVIHSDEPDLADEIS